ncbi:hypothetical protein ABWJ92_07395 [Streptomyces sp. NPDC000609]|uniref:hypothetical protein n=1 Tax=Streptomyces sp. NPDC000609 TaxID=3160957 RepID=UPI0033925B3B
MHLDHTRHGPAAVSADAARPDGTRRALRIGLGGPVGSGKTATVAQQRGPLPVAFTSLASEQGVGPVADWVRARLADWTA